MDADYEFIRMDGEEERDGVGEQALAERCRGGELEGWMMLYKN